MIGHTPRAVPIKEGALKGRWRSDKSSAYRPWLFALGFLANAISITLLLLMGGLIFAHVGWATTSLAFRLVDGWFDQQPVSKRNLAVGVALGNTVYLVFLLVPSVCDCPYFGSLVGKS
jgi:hypothetical protein